MKKIKLIFFPIITLIVIFVICYLIGSFNQVSFDISEWTNTARDIFCISFAVLGLFFSVFTLVSVFTE